MRAPGPPDGSAPLADQPLLARSLARLPAAPGPALQRPEGSLARLLRLLPGPIWRKEAIGARAALCVLGGDAPPPPPKQLPAPTGGTGRDGTGLGGGRGCDTPRRKETEKPRNGAAAAAAPVGRGGGDWQISPRASAGGEARSSSRRFQVPAAALSGRRRRKARRRKNSRRSQQSAGSLAPGPGPRQGRAAAAAGETLPGAKAGLSPPVQGGGGKCSFPFRPGLAGSAEQGSSAPAPPAPAASAAPLSQAQAGQAGRAPPSLPSPPQAHAARPRPLLFPGPRLPRRRHEAFPSSAPPALVPAHEWAWPRRSRASYAAKFEIPAMRRPAKRTTGTGMHRAAAARSAGSCSR